MDWYAGVLATTFCAGVGWYVAQALVDFAVANIFGDEEDERAR